MREALQPGQDLQGPAIVIEPHQTIVVEAGWMLTLTVGNDIVLTRAAPRQREKLGAAADPVLLEVFNNLFMAIAEQMGEMSLASMKNPDKPSFIWNSTTTALVPTKAIGVPVEGPP